MTITTPLMSCSFWILEFWMQLQFMHPLSTTTLLVPTQPSASLCSHHWSTWYLHCGTKHEKERVIKISKLWILLVCTSCMLESYFLHKTCFVETVFIGLYNYGLSHANNDYFDHLGVNKWICTKELQLFSIQLSDLNRVCVWIIDTETQNRIKLCCLRFSSKNN